MEYLSIFNEERLKEIVYESVQKCMVHPRNDVMPLL